MIINHSKSLIFNPIFETNNCTGRIISNNLEFFLVYDQIKIYIAFSIIHWRQLIKTRITVKS